MPLADFYGEFVKTQDILNKRHLGLRARYDVFGIAVPPVRETRYVHTAAVAAGG